MKKIFGLVLLLAVYCVPSFSAFAQSSAGSSGIDLHSDRFQMHRNDDRKPHFALSANDPLLVKDYWDSLFVDNSGYDSLIDKGLITTFASDEDNLYIGGSFEFFDGIFCENIIHYDRKSGIWSTMDNGFDGTVNVLKIHNGKLYAGGAFSYEGGSGFGLLEGIAVWDPALKKWVEVGGGVNNSVTSIEFIDSSIIIGGYFTRADRGTAPLSYIGKWNGEVWDDMNGGVASTVYALLATGDSLYVGGSFYTRSSQISDIALYIGGNWEGLGNGLDGEVYALAMYKGQLWVGGDYTSTTDDTQLLNSLAIWDGSNWKGFGSGLDTGFLGREVHSILPIGDSIYIGGSFSSITGKSAHGIVKWSHDTFTAIDEGVYGEVHAIAPFNGSLYVGGSFLKAGNLALDNAAKIVAGDIWKPIEAAKGATGGFSETYINAVVSTPQYVFIGGSFSTIKNKPFNNIAAWDKYNRKWISLGNGVDREVRSLSIYGSNLYVGGSFNYAGGAPASHIAYWDIDAKTWHSMGEGSVRYVSSIAANETGVYAAVFFPFVYDVGLYDYIGRWDGSQWNLIDNTINGYVNAIVAQGTTLTIGGGFTYVDGQRSLAIAQYDGSSWRPLGTGLSDWVRSLTIAGSDIFAAGYFGSAGSLSVQGIARWDGSEWNDLAGGLNAPAYSLAWNGTYLYVGGRFTETTSGVTTKCLARWDGNKWTSVSGGTSNSIYGLAVDNAGLYCGGGFSQVNNDNLFSYRFAILHFGSAGVDKASEKKLTLLNFPNPFAAETTIEYSLDRDGIVKIEVYNLLGVKVKTILNEFKAAGEYEAQFDGTELPNGMYVCNFTSGGVTQKRNISLVH